MWGTMSMTFRCRGKLLGGMFLYFVFGQSGVFVVGVSGELCCSLQSGFLVFFVYVDRHPVAGGLAGLVLADSTRPLPENHRRTP